LRDQPGQPPCRALIDAVLAGHRVVDACGHRAAGQREAGGGPGEHDVVGRRFRWHGEGVDGRGQFADVDGGQQSMPRQASASRSSVPQTRQCGRDHDQPRRGEQVPGPQRQPSAHLGGRDQRGQRERQSVRLGEPPQVGRSSSPRGNSRPNRTRSYATRYHASTDPAAAPRWSSITPTRTTTRTDTDSMSWVGSSRAPTSRGSTSRGSNPSRAKDPWVPNAPSMRSTVAAPHQRAPQPPEHQEGSDAQHGQVEVGQDRLTEQGDQPGGDEQHRDLVVVVDQFLLAQHDFRAQREQQERSRAHHGDRRHHQRRASGRRSQNLGENDGHGQARVSQNLEARPGPAGHPDRRPGEGVRVVVQPRGERHGPTPFPRWIQV